MGGNGTIGGGKSCKARFFVTDPKGRQKDYWDCHDDDVDYPFNVTVDFPDGTSTTATIKDKKDQVRISW